MFERRTEFWERGAFFLERRYKLRAGGVHAASACDLGLSVNTAAGNWHWDDDSASDIDAQIVLRNPASGTYDSWVGTIGSENRDAVLQI
ncbi:hypothetical protein ACFFUT_09795 [Pseudohalocynthiibacter aestuariivivens]|uniref:Uncharacterized protein n=1 Tax=Pseudohalocynthiibacter aestuariivivens TaxID=1591409 RepID=A0ABV5JH47_9RHOB|nr:hypothetical protein [Pseudohalocynthiibacter aestuariivivens]MBS9717887.1 hypothetical protein [Pseudohalocynthiibacter aestuariivivens]MCK0102963.1 hypothetical protein [Pseudohalocynthiibacter sp. F2068]